MQVDHLAKYAAKQCGSDVVAAAKRSRVLSKRFLQVRVHQGDTGNRTWMGSVGVHRSSRRVAHQASCLIYGTVRPHLADEKVWVPKQDRLTTGGWKQLEQKTSWASSSRDGTS